MTKVKENSTRNYNKNISELRCPITYVMNKIGGHWKSIILYYLMNGPKRYSELRRTIPTITEKMLVQHLKQLQEDNLVDRTVEAFVPPHVIYSLTPAGEALRPILMAMAEWAINDNNRYIACSKIMSLDLSTPDQAIHPPDTIHSPAIA